MLPNSRVAADDESLGRPPGGCGRSSSATESFERATRRLQLELAARVAYPEDIALIITTS
jgi:hypothetical protein